MKQSNKVLIATFLLSALIIFIIPAAVNIQYLTGRNRPDGLHIYRTLDPFKTLIIKKLPNCLIVPSDSFRIGFSKKVEGYVSNSISNDTLFVTLKGAERSDSSEVILYIPINKVNLIGAYSSKIRLRGQIRPNETPSYHFELHNTILSLPRFIEHQSYNRLELDGWENSSLVISDFNHLKDLSLSNLEMVTISFQSEVTNLKTTFKSKANVQIIKTNTGTEIRSHQ
jgi:hypothetical protein